MSARALAVAIFLSIALASGAARAQDTTMALPQAGDRVFLLPTANAIPAGRGFISDYELLFLYGGVGIADVVSITAGTSLIPGLSLAHQFSTAQLKITAAQSSELSLALGGSVAFVQDANRFIHIFGTGSLCLDSVWYTASIFYKISGPDEAFVDAMPYGDFSFFYTAGLGLALGVEVPVPHRDDMRIVAELWNHDVGNPRHMAIMGGFRIGNEMLSGSFGLAILPIPTIFPVASFAYRW